MTAEALTLHFIDDLDSKLAQLRQGREHGESLQYFQGFGRYLFADLAMREDEAQPGEDSAVAEESDSAVPDPDQPTLDL